MDRLEPPKDLTQRLLSPPCSPLPADWHDWVEDAPVPGEFNLDAPGVVSLAPEKSVEVGVPAVEGPGKRVSILQFSKKDAPLIVIDSYE